MGGFFHTPLKIDFMTKKLSKKYILGILSVKIQFFSKKLTQEIYKKKFLLFSAERSKITFKAYLRVLGLTDKEL